MTAPRSLFPVLLSSCVLAIAPPARADASVRVELHRKDGAPADGRVRLSRAGEEQTCTTQSGACVIAVRAGGAYTVVVELALSGPPNPKPKTVMIPPSGNVKLVVAVD